VVANNLNRVLFHRSEQLVWTRRTDHVGHGVGCGRGDRGSLGVLSQRCRGLNIVGGDRCGEDIVRGNIVTTDTTRIRGSNVTDVVVRGRVVEGISVMKSTNYRVLGTRCDTFACRYGCCRRCRG